MTHDVTVGAEEKIGPLYQPDILVPAQSFETLRKRANSEPEKKLMLMILEDAVDCFQKYIMVHDARGNTIFAEVEQWIMEENGNWLFSFENVCDALGFNPSYVRQGLLHWKEMKLAEHSNSNSGRG